MAIRNSGWHAAGAAVLAIGTALCAAPLAGHSDRCDPHFYTVLARHMAEGGSFWDPSYLPIIHQRFRDHLPFGVWPWAVAMRLFGDRGLAPLALLCSLGTLSIVLVGGARIFGRPAALAGALVLASTETWFRYAAVPTLDCLLLLFSTAATLPLWKGAPAPVSRWAWAAFLTALAVLVKGPFGLLPLAATALARAIVLRNPREIWRGGLSAAAAVQPAAVFLVYDKCFGTGTWWHGYVIDQLYASALGLRDDGEPGLVPIRTLCGRFWPGLPLAAWGIAIGLRDVARRRSNAASIAALHSLAAVALLCLPTRKIWHHALVVYPALAAVAGTAAAPLLEKMVAAPARARKAMTALAAVGAVLMAASAAGAGAWLTQRACVAPSTLASSLPRDSEALVIAPWIDWRALAALAAEHHLVPWPAVSLGGEHRALAALIRDDAEPAPHPGWRERRRERNWTLWTRQLDQGAGGGPPSRSGGAATVIR